MTHFAGRLRLPPSEAPAAPGARPRTRPRRLRPSEQAALAYATQLKAAEGQPAAAPAAAPRRGGLPQRLQAGVESLSGLAMDDVRVHRDSAEPAKLGALAFTKGSDIHLGPGQERHLPHEAWHVVQQMQGRVAATAQFKSVAINNCATLESEAEIFGSRALRTGDERPAPSGLRSGREIAMPVVQGFWYEALGLTLAAGAAAWAYNRWQGRHQVQPAAALPAGDAGGAELARNASAEVPGLSQDLVDAIAATPVRGRGALLGRILAEIGPKYVSPDLDIRIVYSAASVDLGSYEANELPHDPSPGGTVTIGPAAFDSPAVLYSTIRHELIHAEQFRAHQLARRQLFGQFAGGQQSNAVKDQFDDANPEVPINPGRNFIYVDRHEPGRPDARPASLQEFLLAATEVETHAWEILNASHTGIDQRNVRDPGQRYDFLAGRRSRLLDYFNRAGASYAAFLRTPYYRTLSRADRDRYQGYMTRVHHLAQGGAFG